MTWKTRRSESLQDSKSNKHANNMENDKMNKYWTALKKEDHSDSFYKTEMWLKNSSHSNSKPKNKTGIMIQYFLAHKVKFALVIFTALVLAACNMPVTQNETVGHVISWSVENQEAGDKTTSLPWVDKNSLSINENENADSKVISYNLVLSNSTLEQIQSYSKELGAIPGVMTVNIMPLTEEVERPLYSKMLDDVFKIDINAKNMTDQELSAEVERQLKEGGIDVQTINFRRDENNRRLIDIKMSENGQNGAFQLDINDGNQKMRIEERRKDGTEEMEFNIKGKSDEEIRQMVKDRFKDQNLQDDDIQITRTGDEVSMNIVQKNKDGNKNTEMKMKLESK
jgi:hypothetical protein